MLLKNYVLTQSVTAVVTTLIINRTIIVQSTLNKSAFYVHFLIKLNQDGC